MGDHRPRVKRFGVSRSSLPSNGVMIVLRRLEYLCPAEISHKKELRLCFVRICLSNKLIGLLYTQEEGRGRVVEAYVSVLEITGSIPE